MKAAETNGKAGGKAARDTGADPSELGLRALVWTLAEPARAMRLIDATGLDPRALKDRIGDPAVLAAVLSFLESHEPDLLACAQDIGHPPQALVAARQTLETAS